LRLFEDYVIPGKEEGFIIKLGEVLATRQNTLGASTATELNNLRTTIEALAKTVKEALPGPEDTHKKTWAAVAKGVRGTSEGAYTRQRKRRGLHEGDGVGSDSIWSAGAGETQGVRSYSKGNASL